MSTEHGWSQTPQAKFDGPERRRRPRYLFSAALKVRSSTGLAMSGVSVEISEKGMSAMVSGLLRPGDRVELAPVAGGQMSAVVRNKLGQLYGFEFVNLTTEEARRIVENCQNLAGYGRHTSGS